MSPEYQQKIPTPTLERMATYLTCLMDLDEMRIDTISSADIERLTDINAAQFRKDLSYFGEFGRPGIGYSVSELTRRISRILKVDEERPVVVVGAGNLGSALIQYPSLTREHFRIAAVFDNNPSKIGKKIADLEINDVADLDGMVKDKIRARIGIVAVPASAAQSAADALIAAGVSAILNFAPTAIRVPDGVAVRQVDFVQELAVLSYYLSE